MKDFFKKPIVYIPTISIILIIIGSLIFSGNSNGVEYFDVIKGDIVQTVSVTGKTKPISYVDLGVEKGGKVVLVSANVGDRVVSGQVLVKLDTADLYANLLQSKANLLAEEVKLSEIKKGTRFEELEISLAQKKSAEDSFADTKNSLREKISDAYTKIDDAIRNNIDEMFDNPRTQSSKLALLVNNFQVETQINSERYEIEQMLLDWQINMDSMSANVAKENLAKVKSFLDKMAYVINSLNPYGLVTQETINGYKTSISSARSSINLAISNISSAETAYNSAESALSVAARQYDLKLSGSTEDTIRAQEARVMQMQAQIKNSEAQISKNYIYSPISGIITKQEAKIGEILSSNASVVSVMSDANFEIEAYVPEVNIGKVLVNNVAMIDFDAFVEEIFSGRVIYIEPAETMINNVPNFKVKVVTDKSDSKIKSGLTANVSIETARKKDVLSVPKYAVAKDGDKFYVNRVGMDNKESRSEVFLGLQGDNGYVEILSGLSFGDKVSFSKVK